MDGEAWSAVCSPVQFSDSVVSELFATPQTAPCQACQSFTVSQSLLKFMFIDSVILSHYLILCCLLLLLPSTFPSIMLFSSEQGFHIRWPKYCSFSFSTSPCNEYSGLISLGLTGLISLQSKTLSRIFCGTIIQKHQFFGAQLSLWSNYSSVNLWLILPHFNLHIQELL